MSLSIMFMGEGVKVPCWYVSGLRGSFSNPYIDKSFINQSDIAAHVWSWGSAAVWYLCGYISVCACEKTLTQTIATWTCNLSAHDNRFNRLESAGTCQIQSKCVQMQLHVLLTTDSDRYPSQLCHPFFLCVSPIPVSSHHFLHLSLLYIERDSDAKRETWIQLWDSACVWCRISNLHVPICPVTSL